MKSKDETHSLFHGINKDYRGDGYHITFPSNLESEARDMVSQLGLYLVHQYDKEILMYFTSTAAERALSSPWDSELHCAKTPELKGVWNLLSEVDNTMKFISKPKKRVIINTTADELNATTNTNTQVATFDFNQDTGLVATFRTLENGNQPPIVSTTKTATTVLPQVNHAPDTRSDMSIIGTNGTLAARVSTIKTNLISLTKMLSGFIALQHNAKDDQKRLPTSNVVTPSTKPGLGGPAL